MAFCKSVYLLTWWNYWHRQRDKSINFGLCPGNGLIRISAGSIYRIRTGIADYSQLQCGCRFMLPSRTQFNDLLLPTISSNLLRTVPLHSQHANFVDFTYREAYRVMSPICRTFDKNTLLFLVTIYFKE